MEVLKQCPLFAGIETAQLEALLTCLGAVRRSYKKEAYILSMGDRALSVGIVLSGGVHVVQEDFWGRRVILTHVGPGGLFGEAFSCAQVERLPVAAVATGPAEVLLVDYRKIVTACSSACEFHTRLIANMLGILAQKNIALTQKMTHLGKGTIREKLLSFLSELAVEGGGPEVVIPFDRQGLADYLGVDRSALSRELGQMKRDGLLDYRKNHFTLTQ